ncbi:hypothetical protein BGW80DRAFT_1564433 [Lactifluus volemus]|nr:hypothetical protein BGW80DRAFT_1564433 [Lactifluus volemus]
MSSPNFTQQLMNCRLSIPMGFKKRKNITHRGEEYLSRQGLDQLDPPRVTIESLPIDILLDVFYFYKRGPYGYSPHRWHILVHVCRRWRYAVFEFPHRLDLYLECTANTRVRRTLDVWPSLPIIVRDTWTRKWPALFGNNIIAALERHDRICEIELYHLPCPLLEQFSRAMQVPFPALTLLKLDLADKSVPALVVPDTFLGESAPRLQRLTLSGIPFPTLPKVLQSSHDLVEIRLTRIPNTGYVSPKSMATALSAVAKLEVLEIGFESPASHSNRHALPSTRIVFPSLTQLGFHGDSEYFEDLVARIDTPSIRLVKTEFFNQLIFYIPQFLQFVGRTKSLESFKQADLIFDKGVVKIHHYDRLGPSTGREPASEAYVHIHILCDALDWQVSGLAQICAELSMFLSNVERCNVEWTQSWTVPREDMDPSHIQWLELFRPFTSVKSLKISSGLEELIAPALHELTGDRVVEVLPVLRTLSFSRLNYEPKSPNPFEPFFTARKLSNYPVGLKDLTDPSLQSKPQRQSSDDSSDPTHSSQTPLRVGHRRSNAVDLSNAIFQLSTTHFSDCASVAGNWATWPFKF